MSRALLAISLIGLASLATLAGWQAAVAQTPGQMEYERQQREYWRAQEQQRQEQQRLQQLQQDNARRQQEELNRSMRQTTPGPQGPQPPSTQGSSPSASPSAGRPSTAQNICKAKPVQAGERNPLIGQWRYVGPQAGGSDLMSELMGVAAAVSCPAFRGGFDFRAKSIIASGKEVPANYGRNGDAWWVCTVDASVGFRVANPNRLHMVDPVCVFERADAAAAAPPSASSGGTRAVATPGSNSGVPLRLNSVYTCNGERVVVQRCRSESEDAYCSVQYPDRKSAATGGLTPELAEKRGELVRKLEKCQG
jgi:hypothetical protein